MRECEYCGKSIVRKNAQARFCSDKHRNYARRRKLSCPYPVELINADRWVRWTPITRNGKVTKKPIQANGDAASSTNSATWASYATAAESGAGVGLGFVLGEGVGCIDLDHCLDDGQPNAAARAFIEQYPGSFIEVSPSGDGLHIWGTVEEGPGTKRNIDGLSIERYSVGRYITITGNVYQAGGLLPL